MGLAFFTSRSTRAVAIVPGIKNIAPLVFQILVFPGSVFRHGILLSITS